MKLKTWKEIPLGGVIIEAGNAKQFKTGAWRTKKPITDKSKCTNCMRCVIFCPDAAITVKSESDLTDKEKAVFKAKTPVMLDRTNYDICKGCGICAEECPTQAIEMVKE